MWRLIYKGNKANGLFECDENSKTLTNKNIFSATNEYECFDKIDELGLTFYYLTGGTTQILFSGGSRYFSEIELDSEIYLDEE